MAYFTRHYFKVTEVCFSPNTPYTVQHDHILHKVPSTTRSSNRKFLHLPSRIDSFMHSFFPRAIRLWNQLPDHFIEADNVDTFKSLLL